MQEVIELQDYSTLEKMGVNLAYLGNAAVLRQLIKLGYHIDAILNQGSSLYSTGTTYVVVTKTTER